MEKRNRVAVPESMEEGIKMMGKIERQSETATVIHLGMKPKFL